jgi:hypothetical protein
MKLLRHLQTIEGFLEAEQRETSGLKKSDPYLKDARKALSAVHRATKEAEDVKTLRESARAVLDHDDTVGYGSDDTGYNLLAQLRGSL